MNKVEPRLPKLQDFTWRKIGTTDIGQALHDKRLDAVHIDERQQEQKELRQLMPDELPIQVFKVERLRHAGSLVHESGL